ncbi:hypothetical protein NLJ89_g4049 [Agrocybe chaxingu]|uniref:ACB domain-containing protein n=1 Tax=Agrocybe chaxingu TaxID=84603 RepID=A0A9W8K968_9AGAR|nr:hypothetical protein NLJ89_g4049 [Agrocybe chaxingu]
MASHELIDAQFDRAVEIVQSLPKTGPIQTDYEEKLTMYSLFKQATVGNVQNPRPGMWDMLGRAKWDAWAKHKDLDSYEAKWLYVEALLKVLRKYSDKTIAMNLVEELESYAGDPSALVMSRNKDTGTLSKSPASDGSGSTVSDSHVPIPRALHQPENAHEQGDEDESTSEEESEDEAHELPPSSNTERASIENRPQSSLSSQRYRTPLAGSLVMSPPPSRLQRAPSQQPRPAFETPSAFAEPIPHTTSAPSSCHQYHPEAAHAYRGKAPSRGQMHPQSPYFDPDQQRSTTELERAVENVQVHLAVLTERLETLESRSLLLSRSNMAGSPRRGGGSPSWRGGYRSPRGGNGGPQWDIDDLGMWSIVLNPLSRGLDRLREFATFFATNENRSPSMMIIRRLCLDVSFLVCVVAVIGAVWRKSGVRRREVKAALVVLWRAIIGSKPQRELTQRGV